MRPSETGREAAVERVMQDKAGRVGKGKPRTALETEGRSLDFILQPLLSLRTGLVAGTSLLTGKNRAPALVAGWLTAYTFETVTCFRSPNVAQTSTSSTSGNYTVCRFEILKIY